MCMYSRSSSARMAVYDGPALWFPPEEYNPYAPQYAGTGVTQVLFKSAEPRSLTPGLLRDSQIGKGQISNPERQRPVLQKGLLNGGRGWTVMSLSRFQSLETRGRFWMEKLIQLLKWPQK